MEKAHDYVLGRSIEHNLSPFFLMSTLNMYCGIQNAQYILNTKSLILNWIIINLARKKLTGNQQIIALCTQNKVTGPRIMERAPKNQFCVQHQ